MRHQKKTKTLRLSKPADHRTSMLRNLVASLFEHERITTTDRRARALRSFADGLITLAKRGDLHARRIVNRDLRRKDLVSKLFDDISKRFSDRKGGYTRVLKLRSRHGDNANLSLIELSTLSDEKKHREKSHEEKKHPKKHGENPPEEKKRGKVKQEKSQTAKG
jgi:large subunit ribosomal protein L17